MDRLERGDRSLLLVVGEPPQVDELVAAAGEEGAPVGREGERGGEADVAAQHGEAARLAERPDAHRVVGGRRDELEHVGVRVEEHAVDDALVAAEDVGAVAAVDVEDHRDGVGARRRDERARQVVREAAHRQAVRLPRAHRVARPPSRSSARATSCRLRAAVTSCDGFDGCSADAVNSSASASTRNAARPVGGEELQRALAAAGDVRAVGGDGDAAAGVEAAEALGLGEGRELVVGHRGAGSCARRSAHARHGARRQGRRLGGVALAELNCGGEPRRLVCLPGSDARGAN